MVFFTFEQSFVSFQLQKTLHKVIFYNALKKQLDPDPHWEQELNPDPQKLNADPQPWCGFESDTSMMGRQLDIS